MRIILLSMLLVSTAVQAQSDIYEKKEHKYLQLAQYCQTQCYTDNYGTTICNTFCQD